MEALTTDDTIEKQFSQKIAREAGQWKCLKPEQLKKIIDLFSVKCKYIPYNEIPMDSLDMALSFYKQYDKNYYDILIDGLKNKKIVIVDDVMSNYDPNTGICEIESFGNDKGYFCFVHEFAHYIDGMSVPSFTPPYLNFLAEAYSLYMEKLAEKFLLTQIPDFSEIKYNHMLYAEGRMVRAIEDELYYEKLYLELGKLPIEMIDRKKAQRIMQYNCTGVDTINYLVRYPLGNLISEYLMEHCELLEKNSWRNVLESLDFDTIYEGVMSGNSKLRSMLQGYKVKSKIDDKK